MAEIQIQNLKTHFLGPLSLRVQSGECLCLTGPSGAGKTLLLRALADLDPHEGEVFLNGTEHRSISPPQWRRRVSYLPSESAWWETTVRGHFADVPDGWLERMGFERETLDWEVQRLSTGEKQRLAILRLLSSRPEVLLLDEPTANLDSENAQRFECLIQEMRDEGGVAVVWVSHNREQIARVGDMLAEIRQGRIERGAAPCR